MRDGYSPRRDSLMANGGEMNNLNLLISHYQRPRNWGSFHHKTERVLTGISRSDGYNDFLALQFQWATLPCSECSATGKAPNAAYGSSDIEYVNCSFCRASGFYYYVQAIRHVSVGCGWLISLASWFSEYARLGRVEDLLALHETDIVNLSGLPWIAHNCAGLIREATLDALSAGFKCLIDLA